MWVKIDDRFFHNPKIRRAGKDGRELYLAGLTYVNSELTDGFIHRDDVSYIAGWAEVSAIPETVAKLVELRLWEPVENGFRIHDYHEYNPSRAEVLATRQARAEAGSIGGQHSVASKRQANSEANAEAIATANANPVPGPVPVVVVKREAVASDESDPVVDRLVAHGITPLTANRLAAGRDALCVAWMDYADSQQNLPNPGRYLTANIKFGKPPPVNGAGPPGVAPPRRPTGMSEADQEIARERQLYEAQLAKEYAGPSPPA